MRWNAGHQLSAAVSMRRLTDMNEFTHDFLRFAAGTFVRDLSAVNDVKKQISGI
jgi:hypothetical protein